MITNAPETTSLTSISLQGNVKSSDSNTKFYINDQEVYVDYQNNFSKTVTLVPGENTFVFLALNSYGKATIVEKTIYYTPAE